MKNMRGRMALWMAGVFFVSYAVPVQASEMDILLRKLVEKKVLTEQEAQEVRGEVEQEVARSAKFEKEDVKETVKKIPGGTWLEKTKWAGDLRLRHESQLREPAADRHRERFRLRFGFTTKPWDQMEVGVRLATGASGDPVSTNQSFTGTFDKKAVFIDRAYAKYTPWPWFNLVGGKMEIPFDTATEIFWDGDLTPEGVAVQFKTPEPLPFFKETFPTKLFANVGAFQISELSDDAGDPAMFGFQVGKETGLPRGLVWTSSIGYYDITAVRGKRTSDITQVSAPSGNSTDGPVAAPVYRYDFNPLDIQGKLLIPDILGQQVVLIGDFVHNPVAEDDNGAWQAGIKVGKVTEKMGSWESSYYYKRVEPDAIFGAITDSDFGAGGSNHHGHRVGLRVGLSKWTEAGITYYRTDEIEGAQNKVDTLQVDASVKY